MNRFAPVAKVSKIAAWLAAIIILLVPFHAFLTVWVSSLTGHYTLLRLWKELLLVPIVAGALYILLADAGLRRRFWKLRLIRLIFAYLALLLVCGLVPLAAGDVSAKAMWYGLLVDSRFLVFFVAVLIINAKFAGLGRNWRRLLLGPAIIVAAFAILQYLVLPYDFLRHFGYSAATIFPYETINHNVNHIRAASTLRGANPLGAYLIVPLAALAAAFFSEKRRRKDITVFAAGIVLALIFSFSRSAWIGAVLAVAAVAWLSVSSERVRRTILWTASAVIIIAALLAAGLRNNLTFQDVFLHTDRASTIAESSNQGHSAAFKAAVKDIAHQPQGGGVGTAGPQSVYNDRPARIAENYYLQVGQETGIIGLLLFIAINIELGLQLYRLRAGSLALAMFAALIGLSFVNLLSHAWEDDTLAYIFWGLAAIALTPAILTGSHKRKNGKKITPA